MLLSQKEPSVIFVTNELFVISNTIRTLCDIVSGSLSVAYSL
jgi:hypothetical protein